MVNQLAGGVAGNADLVAYFFLRAMSLVTQQGNLGLIATNTIAQGDTREVGLDRMVADGFTITSSIQSRSWPAASANLEFAGVWGTLAPVADSAPRVSDDLVVQRISTLLEPEGRVTGRPVRLAENAGIAFIGCCVLGKGFILEPEEAQQWIAKDPRNAEVLFPYLNGEDLNSRPDASPSRWVIDFNDLPENLAAKYDEPWDHVLKLVKPERRRPGNKNGFALRAPLPVRWWQYADKRPAMRQAIEDMREVLTVAVTSRTLMPIRRPTGVVFSHALVVFADDSFVDQALLSSAIHQSWVMKYTSGMRGDFRYIPSDCFLTFPRVDGAAALEAMGRLLDAERREIMLRRQLGLTNLYNLVNDPGVSDASDLDMARMRQIHVELDHAVMAAYGWDDVPLDHGFHTYRQMTRWTVSPAARLAILDRLLEENHRRAALQGDAPSPTDDAESEDIPEGDE